jgi:rubrerythrin
MNRETASQMGINKTGIGLSPIDSQAMMEAAHATNVLPDGRRFDEWRVRWSQEAASTIIGSVPPPGTIKGVVKSAADAITGKRPSVLVDHLGARLAFERMGVRLYEALLAKLDSTGMDGPMRAVVQRFQEQELRHFQVVRSALQTLGADETAQTPAADIAGVQSSGLIQVVTDPRTNALQCLDALLTAELKDGESWNMLVGLADTVGHKEVLSDFRKALSEEMVHLDTVRRWVREHMEAGARQSAS